MSNRVLGAAIKSALMAAAPKQVAAAGLTVVSSQVTFYGAQAFAVWEVPKSWHTNKPFPKKRAFKINYPALADDALLTRPEADLVAAYTLHETGHVCYTNNGKAVTDICIQHSVPRSIVHPLANGLEDGRMEHCVIKAGIAKNASYLFGKLLNKLTGEVNVRTFNPCVWRDTAFALAMLSREALGNGNAMTASLLSRIPEPKRSLYAWAMDKCRSAPLGYDTNAWAYKTAIEFYKLWIEIEKSRPTEAPEDPEEDSVPPEVNPPVKPPQDEGFGDLDPEEEDTEFDKDFDDDAEGDQPEAEPDGEPEPGSPAPSLDDDEPEPGEGEGEDGEGEGEDSEGEGEDSEGEGSDIEEGDKPEPSKDGAGSNDDDSVGAGEDPDFVDRSSPVEGAPTVPEPKITDVIDRANSRSKAGLDTLASIMAAPQSDVMASLKRMGVI